jgi:hypothetical protein
MIAADNGHKDVVNVLISHNCSLEVQDNEGLTALMTARRRNHVEIVELIENENLLRRNRNWDRRKALMLLLVGSNYLPSSSPLVYPSSSASSEGGAVRVVQTPVVIQRVDAALTTSSEKVLCDMFLVQHIMRYI